MEFSKPIPKEQINWWYDRAAEAASLFMFARDVLDSGIETAEQQRLLDAALALGLPAVNKMRTGFQNYDGVCSIEVHAQQGHQQVLKWWEDIAAHEENLKQYPPDEEAPDAIEEVDYDYAGMVRLAADYRRHWLMKHGKEGADEELELLERFAAQAEKRAYITPAAYLETIPD